MMTKSKIRHSHALVEENELTVIKLEAMTNLIWIIFVPSIIIILIFSIIEYGFFSWYEYMILAGISVFVGIPIVCIILTVLIMILTRLNVVKTDDDWFLHQRSASTFVSTGIQGSPLHQRTFNRSLKSWNSRLPCQILLVASIGSCITPLVTAVLPTVYTTVRINFLGDLPGDWGFNIASQLAWVNLIALMILCN